MVDATEQVRSIHVTDGIIGVASEGEVLGLGASPPLVADIGLTRNLEVVDIVVIADIEPVDGGKDMLPPFVPVGVGYRGIRRPARLPLIVPIAQANDRADMSSLERTEEHASVAVPPGTFRVPPVIAAARGVGHDRVPPLPVDDIWVSLDLIDGRRTVDTIIVLCLPARHATIQVIGIDAQVLQVGDVETAAALDRTDVARAVAPLRPVDSDRGCCPINGRRGRPPTINRGATNHEWKQVSHVEVLKNGKYGEYEHNNNQQSEQCRRPHSHFPQGNRKGPSPWYPQGAPLHYTCPYETPHFSASSRTALKVSRNHIVIIYTTRLPPWYPVDAQRLRHC